MAAIRLTLQNRITTLLVISSVIFISAFSYIQLNNQVSNLNRYNTYHSNLSGLILKNNLDAIVKQALEGEDLSGYMQDELKKLIGSDVIKEAVVFDPNGRIVASTDENMVGGEVLYKDSYKIKELDEMLKSRKFFLPDIDTERRSIDMYIAIRSGAANTLAYTAKTSFPMNNLQEALGDVYKPIIFTVIIVVLANLALGYIMSKNVIGPIKALNKVTKIIAEGDLSIRTDIRTNDELEELGSTFNFMTEELIKMKDRAENANPLTKLPGNIVIHEETEKRIRENRKFMVIYCDLDNFKAFNDKYGIAKGDEAIKLTADVFRESAKLKGSPGDFVGHEGGDDFILLTAPENAQAVADYITGEFDKRVRSLYTKEDLDRGHIVAHARDGSIKEFPIMTISLAGVTNTHRVIASYGEVTNIAAEVKKKAKAIEGSVFVVDKRTGDRDKEDTKQAS